MRRTNTRNTSGSTIAAAPAATRAQQRGNRHCVVWDRLEGYLAWVRWRTSTKLSSQQSPSRWPGVVCRMYVNDVPQQGVAQDHPRQDEDQHEEVISTHLVPLNVPQGGSTGSWQRRRERVVGRRLQARREASHSRTARFLEQKKSLDILAWISFNERLVAMLTDVLPGRRRPQCWALLYHLRKILSAAALLREDSHAVGLRTT